MQYYLLRTVSDPEIKGVKTGLGQVELDENNPTTQKLENFSIHYWKRGKAFPDFDLTGCTATLYKGAKLTDFLDFSPNLITCNFMISERLAEVFSKFNIQKNNTYPVTLYEKGKELKDKYYIFCCPYLGYEVINFRESVFYTKKSILDKERNYIQYDSAEDFCENFKVGRRIEKLVLNSNFNKSLDYFQTRIGGIHISEGLKDAIEILGFTGVNIFNDKEPLIMV